MKYVLDASAVLACINDEPGAEKVAALIASAHCLLSTVNQAEVMTRLCDWGMSEAEADEAVGCLELDIVAFDAVQARVCAALRRLTRSKGLSLGDRACLALASQEKLPVLTADRPWLDLATVLSLDIHCIRPAGH